ncbi:MAG: Crp/Fnr family transcriptional regulator [Burkholderiales bacterium]|nr:Crp/Fnr family transcriptional regulator [Burkholderiales bacterium]
MRAAAARPPPRQNHLLAALPLQDYERLLPALEPVELPLGQVVQGAGEQENYLYFLTAGIVCRYCNLENGAVAAFTVSGKEGVIGIGTFLGGDSTLSQAVVVSTGSAYRLRAEVLHNEFKRGGPLQHSLLHYMLTLLTQTGQTAVCNRHHRLEQQLCRWILSCLDRVSANELTITQELIANIMGVRREGITEAEGRLQQAGIISCSRGHMTVLDRQQLEARACECYLAVKKWTPAVGH